MKIRINNKIIFETFHHNIFELDLKKHDINISSLKMNEITENNIEEVGNAIGNTTKKWIKNKYPYVKGFFFTDAMHNNVGSCWIMFKGGNEKLYKVRKHESLIFRLGVEEKYRGLGYSKEILNSVVYYLKTKDINNTCLDCSTKNHIANNLYMSFGFKKIKRIFFVRLFNRNIPYFSL